MRKLILFVGLALTLGGCVVRTGRPVGSRGRPVSRTCPPAHHWNGYACEHNGKAKGHYK